MTYYKNTTAQYKSIPAELSEKLFLATTGHKALRIGDSITIDDQIYTFDYVSMTSYNAFWKTRGISVYFRVNRSIVRISDHWSKTSEIFARSKKFNCGAIASCFWTLMDAGESNVAEVRGYGCGSYGYKVIGGKCAIKSFQEME